MQLTKRLLPILCLTLGLAASAFGQEPAAPKLSDEAKAAATANNEFAYELYRQLANEEGNTFFSPFSIEAALGMTAVGARGETAKQMKAVLHMQDGFHAGLGELTNSLVTTDDSGSADEPGPTKRGMKDQLTGETPQPEVNPFPPTLPKPEVNPFPPTLPKPEINPFPGGEPPVAQEPNHLIRIANRLWPQTGFTFKAPFMDTVTENYGAGVEELDYANLDSNDTINRWVEEQTMDAEGKPMIKDLIKEDLSAATRLVLTNAIYFKGDWASQFDEDDTELDGKFSTLQGAVQDDVPLMNQSQSFGYANVPGVAQILELPYQGDALSMFVFLPEKGEAAFKAFESKLSAEAVDGWLKNVWERQVQVTLPRFELESEFELGKSLGAMGMTDAFDGDLADFTGMSSRVLADGTEQNILHVSKVIHKAVARVDEKGSEMAAATAVIVVESTSALPSLPAVFRADRPFVFMVRDNASGAVLFMGRVLDPK